MFTTHKAKYVKNGKETSEYNKKYYKKYREELLERANRRLTIYPNLNKDYYRKNKEIKVNIWWYNLDLSYRFELIESYYPDKAFLMDVDEMWNGLDWNDKWDIYKENRDEVVDVL